MATKKSLKRKIIQILKQSYEKCGTPLCPQEKSNDTSDCAECDASALLADPEIKISFRKKEN